MIPDQLLHPEPQTLRAFHLGQLEPGAIDAVERHLAECQPCCETLAGLGDDTFVSLVRGVDTVSDTPGASRPDDPTLVGEQRTSVPPGDIPPELAGHSRYRVLELLGSGGMGAVYRAEHRLMRRTVALKVVNPRLTEHPSAVERFQREVRAAARLNHPNIVTAHDAEQAGGLHFMVMEFVDGTDLAEVVRRRGPLPAAEACDYIRQAALGLQHAHEQGMVHRDIKPQNLMVEGQGSRDKGQTASDRTDLLPSTLDPRPLTLKILDFGLAHFASEAGTQAGLTEAGAMMGTPDYMAPEQARDAHAADIRADIYSLGCTLYFLLAGRPPFPEGGMIEKVMAHTERQPEPLATFRRDLPPGLHAILHRMLAKAPAERFQTPADVARALAPFAEESSAVHGSAAAASHVPGRKAVRAAVAAAVLLVLLAGTIFTVATDKGTLRIVSPPGADVEITIRRGGEVRMRDRASGSRVHRLPSGEYEVDLKDDARFRLDKNRFTLTRGEEELLTITSVDGAALREQQEAGRQRGSGRDSRLPRNLVANPGFEEDSTPDAAAYWIALTKTTPAEPEARCVRDTATAHEGRASVRIDKSETKFPVAEAGFLQTIQELPAGKLVLSGYLKTKDVEGAAAIKLRIVDYRQGPVPIKWVETPAVTGTTDWTRYRAEIEVPAGTTGELGLVLQGTGTVWFDEISLTPVVNLLDNGGFEERDEHGRPLGWTAVGDGVNGVSFGLDQEVKHGGTASAHVANSSDVNEPWNWRQAITENLPYGKTLRLSGWAKTKDAAPGASVGVQVLDADGRLISFHTTQHSVNFAGSVDWKPFQLEFTVPESTAQIAILAMILGRGSVWFDDFELTVVEPPQPAEQPAARPAEAAPDRKLSAATLAALIWLAMVDGKEYDVAWEGTAEVLKVYSAAVWERAVQPVRDKAGALKSRRLASHQFLTTLPGMAEGEYVILGYESEFENFKGARESVTLIRDEDGRWRVAGYHIVQLAEILNAILELPTADELASKPENAEDAALKATQAWLELRDTGKYAECWEHSARLNRDMYSKEQFIALYNAGIKPLGEVTSRSVIHQQYAANVVGGPKGHYVVSVFQTEFEDQKKFSLETVIVMLEPDGQWRVGAYTLR
ncbi:MAG TPA: DUF4019 domain-containing protein [Planctomycetaceae bacterium]|nr:DUF4019 domain-containing protein [Planctomycetaceae bacterium]